MPKLRSQALVKPNHKHNLYADSCSSAEMKSEIHSNEEWEEVRA